MWKILVADDNVDSAETLAQLLSLELTGEVEIVVVHDGAQALTAAFTASAPSTVILDIDMPHVSGIEAAAEIRRSTAPVSSATLVAMSGDDNLLARAGASGLFQAVLRKPLELEALLSILAPGTPGLPQDRRRPF